MSKRKAPSMTGGKSFRHDSESENESENGFASGSGDDSGGEFSEDNEPEEEGNGNDDFSSDEESDGSEEDLSQRSAPDAATSVPLYKRLAEQSTDDAVTAVARERVKKRRIRDSAKEARTSTERVGIGMTRTNKNAPAEMPSNRPVRRLRVDANNASKKTVDPRFSDISGKLDERIFAKNYSFLDEKREKEIEVLSKTLKKIKSTSKKEELKAELLKMKQLSKERARGLRVMQRLDSLHAEEREKVKAGKKPFFLKQSVKNTINLEERYKELRKDGKLHKFMEKRRKKNSNKDHRWLPTRRSEEA
uniref:rRNA biogenesis protein RRP36 n=1 Tax=Spumella elongata TaxID=89044 RepID=A0A7S3M8N6_9STRA|eukprot:CAMPEP_0184992594 /NCGR_PEP_ID=MMETSP1098-20130426/41864_1 /TAXON_ID=89044 /ORGANISM="Spumella elongata, Strain CCAP 955/1" /LENGTH=304 /DNA_ID=CAMNT_0027518245 /DNA_START=26 /DNA_END=940 /DNA_ORIENTATION=+